MGLMALADTELSAALCDMALLGRRGVGTLMSRDPTLLDDSYL
jgi:hypothetical protein